MIHKNIQKKILIQLKFSEHFVYNMSVNVTFKCGMDLRSFLKEKILVYYCVRSEIKYFCDTMPLKGYK